MPSRAALRRGRRLVGLSLAAALLLSGCSDDGGDGPEEPGTSDGAPGAQNGIDNYLEVPDGVDLTDQGSDLEVGDTATVAYEPRQDVVGVLEITVTRLEKASFRQFVGWKLSPETTSTTPYFVHAKVENVGDSDLGARRVPLYAIDGNNKLIESSTFQSTFKPCPSEAFPKKFRHGDRMRTCLVYLAPDRGDLAGVSFRPTEDFDPIVWTGEVTATKASEPERDKRKDKGKQKN